MVDQYKNFITLLHEYMISTVLLVAPQYKETLIPKEKKPTTCDVLKLHIQNKTAPTLNNITNLTMQPGTQLS